MSLQPLLVAPGEVVFVEGEGDVSTLRNSPASIVTDFLATKENIEVMDPPPSYSPDLGSVAGGGIIFLLFDLFLF